MRRPRYGVFSFIFVSLGWSTSTFQVKSSQFRGGISLSLDDQAGIWRVMLCARLRCSLPYLPVWWGLLECDAQMAPSQRCPHHIHEKPTAILLTVLPSSNQILLTPSKARGMEPRVRGLRVFGYVS